MLRTRIIGSLSLAAVFLSLQLAAEPLTFELDPAATRAELSFNATLHTVDGTLRAKSGRVRLDSETGTAQGRLVLDATSADTGNSRRDRKMHEKILESGRFPEIVFEVDRISGALNREGRSDVLLHGTLEMHGVRKPSVLPATVLIEEDRVQATARLTVPYMEWGLADPSFFVLRVAKEVRVVIHAAGRLVAASPSGTQ